MLAVKNSQFFSIEKNGVLPQCVLLRVSNDSSLQYCCSEFLLDIQDAEKMTSDWWKRNDDHCSHAIRNPYIYTMASFFRPTKSKFLHMKKTHVSITDEENEKNFNDEHLKMKESFTTVFENHPKCRILNFPILAFFTIFCPTKIGLSGNTVWLQASRFQRIRQNGRFLAF